MKLFWVYKGVPEDEGPTKAVAVNPELVSSVVEFDFGVKVTLTTGEVFMCSNEFVPTMQELNRLVIDKEKADRMFQLWQNISSRLAGRCGTEEFTKKEADDIAGFAHKIADNYRDFQVDMMD
jgi:hypothetical protein